MQLYSGIPKEWKSTRAKSLSAKNNIILCFLREELRKRGNMQNNKGEIYFYYIYTLMKKQDNKRYLFIQSFVQAKKNIYVRINDI